MRWLLKGEGAASEGEASEEASSLEDQCVLLLEVNWEEGAVACADCEGALRLLREDAHLGGRRCRFAS